MDNRKGIDIFDFLSWVLAFFAGILTGVLLKKYFGKRGNRKRTMRKVSASRK